MSTERYRRHCQQNRGSTIHIIRRISRWKAELYKQQLCTWAQVQTRLNKINLLNGKYNLKSEKSKTYYLTQKFSQGMHHRKTATC